LYNSTVRFHRSSAAEIVLASFSASEMGAGVGAGAGVDVGDTVGDAVTVGRVVAVGIDVTVTDVGTTVGVSVAVAVTPHGQGSHAHGVGVGGPGVVDAGVSSGEIVGGIGVHVAVGSNSGAPPHPSRNASASQSPIAP
jgi:hypothetical protein